MVLSIVTISFSAPTCIPFRFPWLPSPFSVHFVDAACATRAARTPHRALISTTPSLLTPPSCFFLLSSVPQICLFSSVTKLLSSHRLSSVTQLTLTNRPPSILHLSPVHHMQPDASCEAVASFLSCFAFDDYELTCSTTSLRSCSFPFNSSRPFFVRAHTTASFSLRSTSFISLFRIS